jgi:hypothetical protein
MNRRLNKPGESAPQSPAGVFVTRGMGIRVPEGALVIRMTPSGQVDATLHLEVALDMCPYWLRIAAAHLREAEEHSIMLTRSKEESERQDIAGMLEREFSASMQAAVAAAIAIDAMYASVKDRIELPAEVTRKWRTKRAPRYKQVAEVFRRAFGVKPGGLRNLLVALKELYRFRDLAVHPPGSFTAPILHPGLGSSTEWRFVAFSWTNAKQLVNAAIAFSYLLVTRAKPNGDDLAKYCEGLLPQLEALRVTWEARYGPLTDVEAPSTRDK